VRVEGQEENEGAMKRGVWGWNGRSCEGEKEEKVEEQNVQLVSSANTLSLNCKTFSRSPSLSLLALSTSNLRRSRSLEISSASSPLRLLDRLLDIDVGVFIPFPFVGATTGGVLSACSAASTRFSKVAFSASKVAMRVSNVVFSYATLTRSAWRMLRRSTSEEEGTSRRMDGQLGPSRRRSLTSDLERRRFVRRSV
jgi:hypothetical protein